MKLKKLVSAGLVAVMATSLLAGCGGSKDSSETADGKKNLSIFIFANDHESTVYKSMIDQYKKDHADTIGNIDVQITTQDEYSKTLTGMMTAGDLPDIFYVGPESVEQFVENGYIEDLQPILDKKGISTDGMLAQEALDSYRYDGDKTGSGDLYALPKDASVFAYAYNKDLFDEAGLDYPDPENPYTYDEFIEVCKKLTKDTDGDGEIDQWGCGFANAFMLQPFVWSNGASYLSDDHKTVTIDTPEFKEALKEAAEAGVHVVAYDCSVREDEIRIQDPVPVILENPELYELSQVLVPWYQKARRDLPWRHTTDPYRIWVSEIMLQQTRVEAVKRYYARFMEALPNVNALANVEEDKLLKLWEGLGYYNRVRNMQKAARQIMVDYNGTFPKTYEEIQSLTGIGNYTAGAISSFSFGLPYPAVDGNVLRVITRITADDSDIMKQSTRKQIEEKLKKVIPKDCAGDFNQGLIELGAIVCVPNGEPKCEECPAAPFCQARIRGKIQELPVKEKAKARRIEKKTVLILRDEDKIAICKRPAKGLLAGLYELPNIEEHLNKKEITQYCKEIGLMPIHIKKLPAAKHIFSHIEWQMIGYDIRVDELEKTNNKKYLFIHPEEIQKEYPIPSAFEKYMKLI